MKWLKKRLQERSTKLQLLQLISIAVSVSTGVLVETIVTVGAAIAGLGAVVPDNA